MEIIMEKTQELRFRNKIKSNHFFDGWFRNNASGLVFPDKQLEIKILEFKIQISNSFQFLKLLHTPLLHNEQLIG